MSLLLPVKTPAIWINLMCSIYVCNIIYLLNLSKCFIVLCLLSHSLRTLLDFEGSKMIKVINMIVSTNTTYSGNKGFFLMGCLFDFFKFFFLTLRESLSPIMSFRSPYHACVLVTVSE